MSVHLRYVVNADRLAWRLAEDAPFHKCVKYSPKGSSFHNLIARNFDIETLKKKKERFFLTPFGTYDIWRQAFVHFETPILVHIDKCVPKGMGSLVKFHKGVQFVVEEMLSTNPSVIEKLVKQGAIGERITVHTSCVSIIEP